MLKILLNTLLGLVLIIIWSRFVDLPQIFSTISKINLFYLLPIFLSLLFSPVLRAIRLKIFLSERRKIDLKDLIYLNGVAWMLNFLIPIRAGELAKGIYLNTKYDLPLGKSVIWIFLDRFLDFIVVLVLAGVLLLVVPTSLNITVIKFIMVILILVLLIIYLAVFQNHSKFLLKLSFPRRRESNSGRAFFNWIPAFAGMTVSLLEAFAILNRHPKDLIKMLGITVLAYGADALVWYFSFLALGFPQSFIKMYLGQLLSALTYLIPAAPGYIGSAEASGLLVLSGVFGISNNLASAATVLFHILSAVFVLIFGLISVFSLKIDLKLILNKALKRK